MKIKNLLFTLTILFAFVSNVYCQSPGKSLDFNGTSQQITTPTFSNNKSFMMWVYIENSYYLFDNRTAATEFSGNGGFVWSGGPARNIGKIVVDGVPYATNLKMIDLPQNKWVNIYVEFSAACSAPICFL